MSRRELEIHDDLPYEDWDESAIRAEAAEEVERLTEEAQPGTDAREIEAAKLQNRRSQPGAVGGRRLLDLK